MNFDGVISGLIKMLRFFTNLKGLFGSTMSLSDLSEPSLTIRKFLLL